MEAENCQLLVEQMVGSISWRNCHAPGKRPTSRRKWFLGSVAISDKRVLVYRYNACLLNFKFSDTRIQGVDFSTETAGVLSILHDVSLSEPTWSGEVEICFQTLEGLHICSTVASRVHRSGLKPSRRAPAR